MTTATGARPSNEPLPQTEPLPTISNRRSTRPLPATPREHGVGLVPRSRLIGFGGFADMLAVRRHHRRLLDRGLSAA